MTENKTETTKQNHSVHHVLPVKTYVNVWITLLILTVVTVGTSYIDFGGHNNIIIAMVIATVKALLVTMFFMGLKYDSAENNVTFYIAVVFLAIFVALTASDLFYRKPETPVRVQMSETPPSSEVVDMKALLPHTPEIIAKGREVFTQQCVSCHGAQGQGDGPAAAALNPKPRNLTGDKDWKNGRLLSSVYKTVSEGLPGTSMPSFGGLSVAERMSLAHYVRSLMTSPPQDSADDIAKLEASANGPIKKKISIEFAIERMTQPEKK